MAVPSVSSFESCFEAGSLLASKTGSILVSAEGKEDVSDNDVAWNVRLKGLHNIATGTERDQGIVETMILDEPVSACLFVVNNPDDWKSARALA